MSVHVDAVNNNSSLAQAEEAMRKASAVVQTAQLQQGAKQELKSRELGQAEISRKESTSLGGSHGSMAPGNQEVEMVSNIVTEALGAGAISASVDFLRQRNNESPEKSSDAQQMISHGMASSNMGSFEGMFKRAPIETSFKGPTLGESSALTFMGMDSIRKESTGVKVHEEDANILQTAAQVQRTIGVANEQVMTAARKLTQNAPRPAGFGSDVVRVAVKDLEKAKATQDEPASRFMVQPENSMNTLGLNQRVPKGPTNILAEIES